MAELEAMVKELKAKNAKQEHEIGSLREDLGEHKDINKQLMDGNGGDSNVHKL